MMRSIPASLPVLASVTLLCVRAAAGEPDKTIELWPGVAPGEEGVVGEERDLTKASDGLVAGKYVIRLGNVSKPTISIYRPAKEDDTGAAVVVCPGGGYSILALDLEGTEVCEWLNSVGVTGVLLKYRVPKRASLEKHAAALQDAQRAIGLVRSQAKDLGIDPRRIGVLGFSAGGHLAAAASSNYEIRTYPTVDQADTVSCRPDFAVLIYPAYLTVKEEGDRIAPDLKISTNTPPTFIAMSQDDPVRVETALFYTLALKNAHVPVELHIYPTGGHGYGLRPSTNLVTTWPKRATEWMRSRGILERK
jgi:acetyl esterase/lipase